MLLLGLGFLTLSVLVRWWWLLQVEVQFDDFPIYSCAQTMQGDQLVLAGGNGDDPCCGGDEPHYVPLYLYNLHKGQPAGEE